MHNYLYNLFAMSKNYPNAYYGSKSLMSSDKEQLFKDWFEAVGKKIIKNNGEDGEEKNDNIQYYSSMLPRAMETAMLFSTICKSNHDIYRLLSVNEDLTNLIGYISKFIDG